MYFAHFPGKISFTQYQQLVECD